jgi:hypothetical protein
MRSDHSGWRRNFGDERYIGGRRKSSPEEDARKKAAHALEKEAHQPNGGSVDWITTLQKTDPKKAKKLQQTTPSETPLRPLIR